MSHTYNGTAAAAKVTTALAVTLPDDATDAESAASVNTPFQAVTDTVESIRYFRSANYFGPGTDGSGTLDGVATVAGMAPTGGGTVYTAVRDLCFTDITINTNINLKMAGFRLFVSGTLTINGTGAISCDGNAGGTSTGGTPAGSLLASLYSGGTGGASSSNAPSVTNAVNALGGAGGIGGAGSGGSPFGGATATAPVGTVGDWRHPMSLLTGLLFGVSGVTVLQGGGGGGGGGGGVGGAGGGGGGPGGVLIVAANVINLGASSVLSALGGQGGSGASGGGKGGGGGGGAVILVYHSQQSGSTAPAGRVFVTGGAVGGTGGGAPAAGSSGNSYIVQI